MSYMVIGYCKEDGFEIRGQDLLYVGDDPAVYACPECGTQQTESEMLDQHQVETRKEELARLIKGTQKEIREALEQSKASCPDDLDSEMKELNGYLNDLLKEMRVIVEKEELNARN